MKIRAILRTIIWNKYIAFQWWDTATGCWVGGITNSQNDDNIYQAIFHVNGGFWDNGVFFYRDRLTKRDWEAATDGFELVPDSSPRSVAEWIKTKLACTIQSV